LDDLAEWKKPHFTDPAFSALEACEKLAKEKGCSFCTEIDIRG
jgi:hypothetical protein